VALITSIRQLQGESLFSSYDGDIVNTTGVVTAVVRRGFFLQTPNTKWDGIGSDAIFVYSRDWRASMGAELEVTGKCVNYLKNETAKPVTQIILESAKVKRSDGATVKAITLDQQLLPNSNEELAILLNSLEGMLVALDAGHTFIAPSNKYGDYVVALDHPQEDQSSLRTADGGMLTDPNNELRWLPGFRVNNYNHALRLNVGAKLKSSVEGPLNYRVGAYQMAVTSPFKIDPSFIEITKSTLKSSSNSLTIMTLNCFNLDSNVESEHLVTNPRLDVDDDWGEGRFHTLANAIVLQANCPDIVALQEIQDNDGAELSEVTDASETYELLCHTVEKLCGVLYEWIDMPPELGQDGGQPGGNIRNGFLYNPKRVLPDRNSLRVLGENADCFDDSRKPLVCDFIEDVSGSRLSLINVHLASKRHQESIFSPQNPGIDGKLEVRVQQAKIIQHEANGLFEKGGEYYITGDFNDTEHSPTLEALTAKSGVNLVMSLAPEERYDYNHRGHLQVLMHGIVPETILAEGRAEYEIIHGNELLGITPGEDSDKPSDHAYVIAKIKLK
jgi:predicted extracellular nuclease